jgi:hypothetical protein
MLNQFSNLSCYEEFEIQSALVGISKVDVLKEIGHKIDDYYFFVSNDGIFNWYDLKGNHVENPGVLKEIKEKYIPKNIIKCVILNNVTSICNYTFSYCESLKEITIPDSVISIGKDAFSYCESLKEITIPDSVISIGKDAFYNCNLLKQVIFKGKTLEEVKQMDNYPWDINDESIIKCV